MFKTWKAYREKFCVWLTEHKFFFCGFIRWKDSSQNIWNFHIVFEVFDEPRILLSFIYTKTFVHFIHEENRYKAGTDVGRGTKSAEWFKCDNQHVKPSRFWIFQTRFTVFDFLNTFWTLKFLEFSLRNSQLSEPINGCYRTLPVLLSSFSMVKLEDRVRIKQSIRRYRLYFWKVFVM